MLLVILLFVCSFVSAHGGGAVEDDPARAWQEMRDEITKMMEQQQKQHDDDMNRMKDSLEDRVEKLEDLIKIGTLRSCAEYVKYGLKTSGLYMVDPDGSSIGQRPFQVYCNFTTGATEIMHDTENVTEVEHCHDPGCYQKNITYIDGSNNSPVSMYQVISLIELSAYCEQTIDYDCFLAPLSDHNIDYAFWEDRQGEQNIYFTGSNYGFHVCDCHYEADGCTEEASEMNTCNCDASIPILSSDSGTITNSTALPIMKMFFGGLNYEMQSGSFQIGRLKCYGAADIDTATSCSSLKKEGVIRSGYYNILEDGSSNTKVVFCDMKSGTYTDVPQVDQMSEGTSPLGTILAWVPRAENGLTPQTIPDGWLPCDGTTIPKGPWAGGKTPDLNTVGAFLRGGQENKTLEMEDDQVQDHHHEDPGHSHSCSASSTAGSHHHTYSKAVNSDSSGSFCGTHGNTCVDPDNLGYSTTNTASSTVSISTTCSNNLEYSGIEGMTSGSRHGVETRPVNMKVSYVIRCW